MSIKIILIFFFSSRRRHTRLVSDWSSDVCSSDLSAEGMRQLTLLVGDDHPLMVDAIKLVLTDSTEFEIAGVASSGAEVIALAERIEPDLVLLDLEFPDADGVEVLRVLQRLDDPPQVVIFSAHEGSEVVD